MASENTILDIKNFSVDFRSARGSLHAVRGIDFSLKKKEVLGIVGESGSGKSVTAGSILQILSANAHISGEIIYNEKNLLDMKKKDLRSLRARKISMIFQEPGRSFDPIYNIGNTCREVLKSHFPEMTEEKIKQRVLDIFSDTGIPNPEERLVNFPHQFSGGLLQRIMIAISLLCEPEILIADEPTTALDVTVQRQIIELLQRLKEEYELSMIFITHDIMLIGDIADRIVVMYAGQIMEIGCAKDILTNPKHPYTKALLKSLPELGKSYKHDELYTIKGTLLDPFEEMRGCPFAARCEFKCKECVDGNIEFKKAGESMVKCLFVDGK